MEDTICAISTAMGVGGISIIRVSGHDAILNVQKIYKGKDLTKVDSHTINYGHIVNDCETIDEVLVSVMREPKTYTTEDIVEINLHGGIATTNKVLELLLNNGCRLAEPGEFTKRAFLNGRIDLVESEAVNDVINAENESARALSINQLTGKLSRIIMNIKENLLALEASIEVNIDYPEYEDLEDMTLEKVKSVLTEINTKVEKMIEEAKTGKMIKNGIDVAIIGKPNVGKSSILNALLEEEKAIVTNIEGTTRDIIEGHMILNGININFIDTAGIRDTSDIVEKIGVDKSIKQLDTADLIILVLNNNEKLTDEEKRLLEKIKNKKHIIFVNKNDLPSVLEIEERAIYGNTVSEDGLDVLKEEIISMFSLKQIEYKDFTYISNARQLSLIEKVHRSIDNALNAIEKGVPVDILAADLAEARKSAGEVLGDTYDEELIDELFSRFCLGK